VAERADGKPPLWNGVTPKAIARARGGAV
jgi:hypothetical protein